MRSNRADSSKSLLNCQEKVKKKIRKSALSDNKRTGEKRVHPSRPPFFNRLTG